MEVEKKVDNPKLATFLKNKRIKEEVLSSDFNHFYRLLKKYKENKSQEHIINEVLKELNTKLFHVKGNFTVVQTTYNKKYSGGDQIRFDTKLKVVDNIYENMEYNLKITRVVKFFIENLKKFGKSEIYCTNLKVTLSNDEFVFQNTFKTKLIIKTVNNDIIDVTRNNESEYIDKYNLNTLNNMIMNLENKFIDYNSVLTKELDQMFFDVSNLNSLVTKKQVLINLYGIVTDVKIEDQKKVITITSLKDSNFIKIFLYNKAYLDLKEKMIIHIKAGYINVSKNIDIIIEILNESFITVIGIVDNEEFRKIQRFRYDLNKDFDFLIDLVNPLIKRNLGKYYIKIKKVYKIISLIDESGSSLIPDFKNLKLRAKCLVDDGTFEAIMFFYDLNVVNYFKIDQHSLNEINKLTKSNGKTYSLFDFANMKNFIKITRYEMEDFNVFAIPFSNIGFKNAYDSSYSNFLEKSKNDTSTSKNNNFVFVNGECIKEKNNNEEVKIPRPCIRAYYFN